jgi:GT2 family glycosyltransferase
MKKEISVLTSLYKAEDYLESFLNEVPKQTCLDVMQLVLIHNEPSDKESALVEAFQQKHPGVIKHVIVPKVESLYASWNRGIKESDAENVVIWNVDDSRTPTSLESQLQFLKDHSAYDVVHGNFVVVNNFGGTKGQMVDHSPTLTDPQMLRTGMCIGPFFMFRKAVTGQIGYFDEQFLSGADYDYALRLAHRGHKIGMAHGVLGYYLDEQKGLSTRGDNVQPIERTVVELRYGLTDKIDQRFLREAEEKYSVSDITSFGEKT